MTIEDEKAAKDEFYEDIEPFYDYKKTPKKTTVYSVDYKEYDENGRLKE